MTAGRVTGEGRGKITEQELRAAVLFMKTVQKMEGLSWTMAELQGLHAVLRLIRLWPDRHEGCVQAAGQGDTPWLTQQEFETYYASRDAERGIVSDL